MINSLTVSPNIQAAAVAGMLVELLEHFLKGYGYSMPPDIGNSLTGLVAVIVAHIWDVLTGCNKTPQQAQSKDGQNTPVPEQTPACPKTGC